MQVLEKILKFEEKAESLINGAKEKASQIVHNQEQEIEKIIKEINTKFDKEKESLEGDLEIRLEKKGKEEKTKREETLQIIKAQFEKKINQAVKIVKEDILGAD